MYKRLIKKDLIALERLWVDTLTLAILNWYCLKRITPPCLRDHGNFMLWLGV